MSSFQEVETAYAPEKAAPIASAQEMTFGVRPAWFSKTFDNNETVSKQERQIRFQVALSMIEHASGFSQPIYTSLCLLPEESSADVVSREEDQAPVGDVDLEGPKALGAIPELKKVQAIGRVAKALFVPAGHKRVSDACVVLHAANPESSEGVLPKDYETGTRGFTVAERD